MATAMKGHIEADFAWTPEAQSALETFFNYCENAHMDITGGAPTQTPRARAVATRSRSTGGRRRVTRRSSGGNGGSGLTNEQLLNYLQTAGRPMHQRELAGQFGVSATTIARKLSQLVGSKQAVVQGRGAQKTWIATSQQPALV